MRCNRFSVPFSCGASSVRLREINVASTKARTAGRPLSLDGFREGSSVVGSLPRFQN